jgi:hypothetical protein
VTSQSVISHFGLKLPLVCQLVPHFVKDRWVGKKKNRMKGCLDGGSEKKDSGKDNAKTRKLIRGQFRCSNCRELGHRKNNPKCLLNGTKKRQERKFDVL